ncbi:RnfH family protein [soil metagenome]
MDRAEVPAASAALAISVAYSPNAGSVELVELMLPVGSTVLEAVEASGLLQRHRSVDLLARPMGVWGASCTPGDVLRDRDRVEIYRPLTVDPKEARRLRYSKDRGKAR